MFIWDGCYIRQGKACVRYLRKWPIDLLSTFSAVNWAGHISFSPVGMFQDGPYQRGQGWRWWSGPTAAHTSSHYPSSQLRAHSAKIMNVERFCCFSLSLCLQRTTIYTHKLLWCWISELWTGMQTCISKTLLALQVELRNPGLDLECTNAKTQTCLNILSERTHMQTACLYHSTMSCSSHH